jgi:hypothetical protein
MVNLSDSGKILQRLFKNLKLTDSQWDDLCRDIESGEPKKWICEEWGLKPHYYKAFKRYMQGND